jgi:hypothetical protein
MSNRTLSKKLASVKPAYSLIYNRTEGSSFRQMIIALKWYHSLK